MKRILAKQTHYTSLINTIKRHPEFAEGKPQLLQLVSDFESRGKLITEILSDIWRPVSIFYAVKRQSELEMNEAMYRFTNLGKLTAFNKHDETLYTIMKTYQEQLYKVSAYQLYLNALHTAELLQPFEPSFTGPVFKSRQLPEFRKQAEEFGVKLTELADQLRRRKSLKKELAQLIAGTNLFLRDQLDHAVNYFQDSYPDFYREYHLIRQPHKRKRRSCKKNQADLPETNLKMVPIVHTAVRKPEPATSAEKKLQLIVKPIENKVPPQVEEILAHEPEEYVFENEIPANYMSDVSELILGITRRAT